MNDLDGKRVTDTGYVNWLRVKYVLQAIVATVAGLVAGDAGGRGVGAGLCGLLLVLAIECLWRAACAGRSVPPGKDGSEQTGPPSSPV